MVHPERLLLRRDSDQQCVGKLVLVLVCVSASGCKWVCESESEGRVSMTKTNACVVWCVVCCVVWCGVVW